ncbi:MAG TPA: ferrochelatase [Pyrinomonadaceae bacterium]|jgi:ferrochelatase|nr:ferrochelatase [Pyrinomonadaceae bacterium]
MNTDYDALLVVSFGGPEGMDDVIPFLENVLRGRNVPHERILQVARHYEMFGGVSPINQQNRNLIAALKRELDQNGPKLPIYWGNRNWHPLLPETLTRMAKDGIRNALAFVTSAYSSYSSCRQYRQNISDAQAAVGPDAPRVEKLRTFYNHPLFIQANIDHIRAALAQFEDRGSVNLVFTAHSIPESMAVNCDYAAQLAEVGALIAHAVEIKNWQLVYQSRSGSPAQPWLGPDVSDHLRALHREGVRNVVVAPVGFVSDHMEVVYDLDVQAQKVAQELGMKMVRSATAGTHPAFVKMIRELMLERIENKVPKNICAADCCLVG